ncbi:MAG: hypothetical protein ACHBN1_21095 [Heteroscytonema crispum UTEX LB 1556]
MFTDVGRAFYSGQPDLLKEAANIAALVFPNSQFQLLSQTIGSAHAALIIPKNQYQLLSQTIGNKNLSITFKNQRNVSENFQLRFFPKIKTLIISGYYEKDMVHLIYISSNSNMNNNYNWLNSRGYEINSPDCIGEKFEFLANKLYPFLEEFFIG